MTIIDFAITAILVFFLKVGIDILLYFKNDAFQKSNKFYFILMHLAEAMYWVLLYKIVLEAVKQDYIFLIIFGLGAILSAFVQTAAKAKLDDKIQGQRKFFTRITIVDNKIVDEILELLGSNRFDLAITRNQIYTSGNTHTVITGSLEDRKRMNQLKDILRDRVGLHVVFIRAEDVYLMS